MKYKFIAFSLSGILILIGLLNITTGSGLNPGIDFAGGTLIRLKFKEERSVSDVRASLRDAGLGNSRIQEIGKTNREYIIRSLGAIEGEAVEQELEAHEIIGNRVIDALRDPEERTALDQGKKDLNSIDESEVALLLQASFPDEAASLARQILAYRVAEGIIPDYDSLEQDTGIKPEAIFLLKEKTFLG